MSTVSQQQPICSIQDPKQSRLWLIAAVCPLLVAPIWLSLPSGMLGPIQSFSGMLLFLLLVSSTISDLRQRKIFNWMTYPAFAWALAINLASSSLSPNSGAIGLSNSIYGAAVCFLLMLIPYSLARGGAGDVKLATAIGALVGIDDGLLVIAFAYIISAVMILGWTVCTQGPLHLASALIRRAAATIMPRRVLPPNDQQALLLEQPIPLAGFFLVAAALVTFDAPAFLRSL